LFTLRSEDGKPLVRPRRVKVYHGFGDSTVGLGGKSHQVAKQEVVAF
jgi:hypothetical protein